MALPGRVSVPLLPTVLFTLCGFATLAYAATILGFGLWLVAPTAMLAIIGSSLRLTQLEDIARAAAMAAGVLSGIFVTVTVVIAVTRDALIDFHTAAPLVAGLACLCGLGVLVGRRPGADRDDDESV